MEAAHISALSSRHLPAAASPHTISNIRTGCGSNYALKSSDLSLCSRNTFSRRIWGLVYSKSVNVRREFRGVVRAEMFGQLTCGLESAWNKLRGEGAFEGLTFTAYLIGKSIKNAHKYIKNASFA